MVLSSSRQEGAQVPSSSGGEWYRKEEGRVVIISCKAWRYGWEYPRGRRLVDCFRVCICIALPNNSRRNYQYEHINAPRPRSSNTAGSLSTQRIAYMLSETQCPYLNAYRSAHH